jgi:Catalase
MIYIYVGIDIHVYVYIYIDIYGHRCPDRWRDGCGYADMFKSEDGYKDIGGNLLPVFFIRDAITSASSVTPCPIPAVIAPDEPSKYLLPF